MFYLAKKLFNLGKISLLRASCPQELERLEGNIASPRAIVVASNVGGFGKIEATGYIPKAVVISGAATRRKLLEKALCRAWAFVEASADLRATEQMEPVELMGGVRDALSRSVRATGAFPGDHPMIYEMYPFENRFSYGYKDRRFSQNFAIDPESRTIGLISAVHEIFGMAGLHDGSAKESMLPVQTGVRYSEAPVRGNMQSFTTGSKNSELVTQIVRNLDNVHAAVAAYLTFTKANGRHQMRPSFYPVALSDLGKIESAIVAQGVDLFDFAVFVAGQPDRFVGKTITTSPLTTKKRNALKPSQFALPGGHYPINDPNHARNALSRASQFGTPAEKATVRKKVAKKFPGIGAGVGVAV